MGAPKLAAVFLLSLAFLLPLGACAWNQTLAVNVTDQNGTPVSGAAIKIIYQKANGVTGNDGLEEGYTNDSGIYLANLSNSVPGSLESRKIIVNVSAGQWAGEQREVEASNESEAIEVQFVAPITLERITIVVLQSDGKEAPNASIYITGSPIKRIADSSGRAAIYVAEGSEITGFAAYRSDGDYFSSASAITGEDGGKEIVVRLPSQAGGAGTANKTTVSVRFTNQDNTPISGERIVFLAGGIEVPSYTNALGVAAVSVSQDGELNATLHKNDYDYHFSFNVTADGVAKEEAAVLPPLLKIDYFESKPDGPDCYMLSAKVSDPRTNRPISIKIVPLMNDTELGELPVSLDENGLYTARVCAGANALVKATAFNAYERAEKTIALIYVPPPLPPEQPNATQGNGTLPNLPQPVTPTSPNEGLAAIVLGIMLLAIISVAAVVVLGRKSTDAAGGPVKYFIHTWGILMASTVRPIIEYLHSIFRKKEPPPPTFGQGSMMPPA